MKLRNLPHFKLGLCAAISLLLTACGGTSGGNDGSAVSDSSNNQRVSCDGSCASAASFLTPAETQQVIAQAVGEATARGISATIAVVDRVGNVLAVYRMANADTTTTISSSLDNNGLRISSPIDGGLEDISFIPDTMAAIAKAITGAFLSSEGNAFTTRTASQIVQDHFNPGEANQPGGPLFGVQFSQLPCSDFSNRFGNGRFGPQRSPLGLSADSGGMPLYKDGTPVGAIGVISDGIYSLDKDITGNLDRDTDELIALAGTFGFAAPDLRRADRITVDGKILRFSDVDFSDLTADPTQAAAFSSGGSVGSLVNVAGYYDASAGVGTGTAFGQPASGIRADTLDYPGLDAFVLVDSNNQERFRPRAGSEVEADLGTLPLQEDEVRQVLRSALNIANRARGQIRRPLDSPARVSITVVDTEGVILGLVRGRDAPIFGLDVSLQKARTAALFSRRDAGDLLQSAPDAEYLTPDAPAVLRSVSIGDYVTAVRDFVGFNALRDGIAFADRSGGNLSRPFFPDGIDSAPPGPLSKPQGEWSPFSVGLQLDMAYNGLINHVAFVAGLVPNDVGQQCTGITGLDSGLTATGALSSVANGIQIFPGSVPIYRGDTLVGGIGVSGDGVDQDDMISFLGLHEGSLALIDDAIAAGRTNISNAPAGIRADTISIGGAFLRYINCPQRPFIDGDEADVCDGI